MCYGRAEEARDNALIEATGFSLKHPYAQQYEKRSKEYYKAAKVGIIHNFEHHPGCTQPKKHSKSRTKRSTSGPPPKVPKSCFMNRSEHHP
jgi:hypothetical protein